MINLFLYLHTAEMAIFLYLNRGKSRYLSLLLSLADEIEWNSFRLRRYTEGNKDPDREGMRASFVA